jgi:DNA replication protein DnaC
VPWMPFARAGGGGASAGHLEHEHNKTLTALEFRVASQGEHLLPRFLSGALKHHLLVIEELGCVPFSPVGAQLMFRFCSTRYERGAVIVTTNLRFPDWSSLQLTQ